MSFQQGLSGLNAATKGLDVIGNNIANASTVGFKTSQAQFADVFAASLLGAGGSKIGIGTQLANVAQQFTQGNISASGNPLDVAVNGNGFFRMSENGAITYSRNGQFHIDQAGYIVNGTNLRVTGYPVDVNGVVVPSTPVDLRINSGDIPPQVTTAMDATMNLDSRSALPVTAIFNPNDPTSYNNSTSITLYDTLGNPHLFSLYFVKGAAANTWTTHSTMDGTPAANVDMGGGAGAGATLTFSTSGALTTAMPIPVTVDLNAVAASLGIVNGAASPLAFDLSFSNSTQFGAKFGLSSMSQDGFTSGRLSGLSISEEGIIQGRYSNGESRNIGQIVLTNFNNPQGLNPLGDNQWTETPSSGSATVGAPNTGSLGLLNAASLEESNVDLTAELVAMITMQRAYQANAQTIKTQDSLLQTLVNLR